MSLPFGNLDIRHVAVSASSSGDNTILAAITGKRIRLVGACLFAAGAVNAKFKSGASTDLQGISIFSAAGDGYVLPEAMGGWLQTAAAEALVLNLSGAVAVTGHVTLVVY